jgi:hypothetical protein
MARLVLCSTLVVGGVAAGLVAASTLDRGAAAASTIGTDLSPDEQALVPLMSPNDRARYLLQKRIQDEAAIASFLSQVQRHETVMDVINNIR